jgi:hypothetical protein
MVWDKEFSLRMVCDDFCIVDDWCRATGTLYGLPFVNTLNETNHLSTERIDKKPNKNVRGIS